MYGSVRGSRQTFHYKYLLKGVSRLSTRHVDGMANGLKEYPEGKICFDSDIIRRKVVEKFGKRAFTDYFKDIVNSVIDWEKT